MADTRAMPASVPRRVVVIGAGPAGLTAADLLTRLGVEVTVFESDPTYVGGISRTVEDGGYRVDIGGHRFFSKAPEVEAYWTELLGDDLLDRPRSSRIYYDGDFYAYPLRPFEALTKLGPVEAIRCVASYLKARLRPAPEPQNFEEWVCNHFGRRLFSIFFETYTEKVWGMKCTEISADWAAQRIKGLSLSSAILSAFRRGGEGGAVIKTLIDAFRYPRLGPGMMWERAAELVVGRGGDLRLGHTVTALQKSGETGVWHVSAVGPDGQLSSVEADHVISSMPIRNLVRGLPAVPEAVRSAAEHLRYRDFLIVALVVRGPDRFDDNWIYVHDPSVEVGRVQNFKSWSPEMVADPATNCYGLEYFCTAGDGKWERTDEELVAQATDELCKLGLARIEEIERGFVVRQAKAYPVYDDHYARRVDAIRRYLELEYPSLHLVGRNGMHKYNNQDHAIMTAMLTVENITAGKAVYDVWRVNQDAEYLESGQAGDAGKVETRLVPTGI